MNRLSLLEKYGCGEGVAVKRVLVFLQASVQDHLSAGYL